MPDDSTYAEAALDKPAQRLSAELELTAILRSEQFRRSRRSSEFLRYVVDQVLAGRGGELKERTIGVMVFGKADDYDTSADAFVRVRANDVRRRLAQYYDAHPARHGVRIELKAGSYVPQFIWLKGLADEVAEEPKTAAPAELDNVTTVPLLPRAMPLWQLAAPTAIALFLAIIAVRFDVGSEDAYFHFWASLLAHRTSIRVSLGDSNTTRRISQDLANAALTVFGDCAGMEGAALVRLGSRAGERAGFENQLAGDTATEGGGSRGGSREYAESAGGRSYGGRGSFGGGPLMFAALVRGRQRSALEKTLKPANRG